MLVDTLQTPLLIVIVIVMFFNLSQRSHIEHGEQKRFASLYVAGLLLLLYGELLMLQKYFSPAVADRLILPAVAVAALAAYFLRYKILIFRRSCERCDARLPIKTILYYDDNLCDSCREGAGEDTVHSQPAEEFDIEATDPLINPPDKNLLKEVPRDVNAFDWEAWKPSEEAVLCYIFQDDHVLLINKKRGLGRGKVNAPGGRIEAGESPQETAVRELQEEVGLTPLEPYEVARLSFVFTNGYSLKGHVFFAHSYEGDLIETDEAEPFWTAVEKIPYDRMWEDDQLWLPRAIGGAFVEARFIFEDDKMLSHRLDESRRA